jgi:HSP20 family protein
VGGAKRPKTYALVSSLVGGRHGTAVPPTLTLPLKGGGDQTRGSGMGTEQTAARRIERQPVMSQDLIRLMNALFLPAVDSCREGLWCPAVDIYRTRRGWLVKFELAGVMADDIDLSALGNRLTLRGVRRDHVTEACHYYRMEIAYSNFERGVELPCDLKRADITTDFRDGMLLVHINDRMEAHP